MIDDQATDKAVLSRLTNITFGRKPEMNTFSLKSGPAL